MMQQHPPPQQQPPAKPERANNSSKSDRVSVAVRVRPHNSLEIAERAGTCIAITPGRPQIVQQDKAFTYDHVFGESTPQQTIYGSCVHALLEGCFDGYNATVFAYGQTGSGKTYTMGTGLESLASFERLDLAAGGGGEHLDELSGIVPRAAHHLFAEIERRIVRAMQLAQPEPQFEVSCQFVELYNEEIFDLLADSRTSGPGGRSSTAIRIQEDPVRQEIYLHGAAWHQVQSREDIMDALRAGAVNRTTAATNQNQQSSRSHAIFTIQLVQQRLVTNNNNQQAGEEAQEDEDVFEAYNGEEGEMEMVHAKFHFVDLAGSERMKRTGATGDRAKESISINSGLLALGNVISALGGGSGKVSHVPYRDSKLTRLLQDSLGGNSRTLMIACVSPCDWDATETLNTLAYANRAKNIKNKRIAKRYSIGCRGRESVDPIASGLVPPLTDTSTIPYPRKLWTLWYTELAQQCPYNAKSMELEDQLPNLEVPEFRFDGPNDLGQMQRIREFISAHIAKQQGIQESVEHNAELFEAKLKQRLCTADLDHQRVAELQKELLRLKGEGSAQIKEIRQLQRANQALSQRLCAYENAQEQGRRKEEGQRYLDAEREAALKSNRRTFQRIAELFESPVPTTSNVARLRKKFGSSEEELMMDAADDDESMGSSGGGGAAAVPRKTPKLAPSAEQQPLIAVSPRKRAADGAVTSVRFYDATNRRLGTAGFVNPRYQRRSRSVGSHGPRVLNHQPVSKIPLGTVFQPKLPRGTKHTTQVDAADLKRHDEYMVTRQEVDAHGNVKTKLFKGEVTPTAGGGTNVHFNDVENLYQESPGQFM